MPTIKTILTKYPSQLSKISSTPKLDVEVILSFAIKKPKEFLYTYPECKLTKKQSGNFNALINRRLKNEPIAYITGEKEFYGLNFAVNKNTLIPRPETELMVEQAIQEIKKTKNQEIKYPPLSQRGKRGVGGIFPPLRHNLSLEDCGTNAPQEVGRLVPPPAEGVRGRVSSQQIILLDIGTGSGCIPISIIKNLPKDIRKEIKTYAIDISLKALTLAKKNARLHGVEKKIKFIKSDLLKILLNNNTKLRAKNILHSAGEKFCQTPLSRRGWGRVLPQLPTLPPAPSAGGGDTNIIITANLPYISSSEYKKLVQDIKKYEPKNALIAGNDGLKYYRKLFKQIQKINSREITLPPRGSLSAEDSRGVRWHITLLIEIDFKTMCPKSKLEKTIRQYLPDSKMEIKKDLSGSERVVAIRL